MSDLPGRRLLAAAVASGRWARPFLLVGPAGGEREDAAATFVRAVLCTEADGRGGVACEECGACHRTARGVHADDHILTPAKGRVSIGVDPVEAVQNMLALRPVEGHAVVVRVPDAERLRTSLHPAESHGYVTLLRELLDTESDSLRSLAVYHIGELGLSELKTNVEALEPEPNSLLANAVQNAVALLTLDPEPAS